MEHHWPGTLTHCGVWHLNIEIPSDEKPNQVFKIVFRHSLAIGNWIIILNGKMRAVGKESIVGTKFQIVFQLGDHEAVIHAEVVPGISANYKLSFNGNDYPEFRSEIASSLGENLPTSITIPSHRTKFMTKKCIALYQILVKAGNGQEIVVEKRYSQFCMLNDLLRAQIDGHIRSSMPSLPGKFINPLLDQSSQEFITSRQVALQHYLNQLLGNSKVSVTTDFLCFLGLDAVTGNPITTSVSQD